MSAGLKAFAILSVLSVMAAGALLAEPINSAIQAVQQATDPSAAIAAYANGFAIDRNEPRLYDAFVSRMVDLGLPEMAYHQAQTLTTLQSNNGLAWAVVAYVHARRGELPEAISAINLAGQFAPDNRFVQHTAGELVAWYDFKADKSKISEAAKAGLIKVRGLLGKNPAFTEAYNTAQRAYENPTGTAVQPGSTSGTSAQTAPEQIAPALVVPNAAQAPLAPQDQVNQVPAPVYEAPLVPPSSYYPDYGYTSYYPDDSGIYLDWGPNYCYDWGPGWVAPAPWCWWEPCGFWGGCNFFPFGAAFAFGDFDGFHHFHHDGFFAHDRHLGRDGFGHDRFGHDGAFWHHDAQGRNAFFGAPARPSASTTRWAQAASEGRAASALSTPSTGIRSWNGIAQRGSLATFNSHTAMGGAMARPGIAGSGQVALGAGTAWAGNSAARMVAPTHPACNSGSSYSRNFSTYSTPHSSGASPAYRAPSYSYSVPRYSSPGLRSFGGYGSLRPSMPNFSSRSFGGSYGGYHGGSFGGGLRSGAGSFHNGGFGGGGGGFHGGGFGGGGGHGGGFGGGGHGGGGHR